MQTPTKNYTIKYYYIKATSVSALLYNPRTEQHNKSRLRKHFGLTSRGIHRKRDSNQTTQVMIEVTLAQLFIVELEKTVEHFTGFRKKKYKLD